MIGLENISIDEIELDDSPLNNKYEIEDVESNEESDEKFDEQSNEESDEKLDIKPDGEIKKDDKIKRIDENYFFAKGALELEKYEDCISYLFDSIKASQRDFDNREKAMFTIALNNMFNQTKLDIFTLENERRHIKEDEQCKYISEYITKIIECDIIGKCLRYLSGIEEILSKLKLDLGSKIYYLVRKADLYLIINEFSYGKERRESREKLNEIYDEATKLARDLCGFDSFIIDLLFSLTIYNEEVEEGEDENRKEKAMNACIELIKTIDDGLKKYKEFNIKVGSVFYLKEMSEFYKNKVNQWNKEFQLTRVSEEKEENDTS